MEGPAGWDERRGPWGAPRRRRGREAVKRLVGRALAARRRPNDPGRGVGVLAYHATESDRSDPWWVDFEGQMTLLEDLGYVVVPLLEAVRRVREGSPVQAPTLAITFDDGWSNNLRVAYPALARRGWSSTVFVTSSFLGRAPFFRPEELRSLADLGVEVGNHTHAHPDLTRLSPQAIAAELAECDRILSDLAGRRPRTFCYPFGLYSPAVRRAVEAYGFDAACTGRVGFNTPGSDVFLLRRVTIEPGEGPTELRWRLAGGYDFLDRKQAWMDAER
ncbi:MAG TPA: polysaccharide deacetylase family protein [Candidatus Polarisedimenticolaceae bacterium]